MIIIACPGQRPGHRDFKAALKSTAVIRLSGPEFGR